MHRTEQEQAELIKEISGVNTKKCMKCGKCSASCPAYEEMALACTRMGSGMSEGEAYREFGRRCKVQCYLKLSSLLEQNRRAGTKNLRAMLETEMADALEQR